MCVKFWLILEAYFSTWQHRRCERLGSEHLCSTCLMIKFMKEIILSSQIHFRIKIFFIDLRTLQKKQNETSKCFQRYFFRREIKFFIFRQLHFSNRFFLFHLKPLSSIRAWKILQLKLFAARKKNYWENFL
jgi:hypothetical protein